MGWSISFLFSGVILLELLAQLFKAKKKKKSKEVLPEKSIIKNNRDESEERYVVKFDIKIGEKIHKDVEFSLSNRDNMNHAVLISRKFMVDSKMSVNPNKKFVLGEL